MVYINGNPVEIADEKARTDIESLAKSIQQGVGASSSYNDNLREIDLNSYLFSSFAYGGYRVYDEAAGVGRRVTNEDYTTIGQYVLYLEAGDTVFTNIDSIRDDPRGTGVILSTFINNGETVTDADTLVFAEGEFTGELREISIKVSGYYILSFKKSETNKLYVSHQKDRLFDNADEFEDITEDIVMHDGYVRNTSGVWTDFTAAVNGALGSYSSKITDMISISNRKGYSLLIDGLDIRKDPGNIAIAYYTDPADSGSYINSKYSEWGYINTDYLAVPLSDELTNFRVMFSAKGCSPYVRFRIVKNDYLIRRGLISPLFHGKKVMAFGDSYVHGHTMNDFKVWYSLVTRANYGEYVEHGHNGAGLCKSPQNSFPVLLKSVSELDEDCDIYFLVFGRNDSSSNVLIGNAADDYDPATMDTNPSDIKAPTTATFMGGLNYLYNYILERHPESLVIAVTPWSFPPVASVTTGLDSSDYIDAIQKISRKWGLYCFDACDRIGVHVRTEAFREKYFMASNDVSHLNEDGHKLIAKRATEVLEKEIYRLVD